MVEDGPPNLHLGAKDGSKKTQNGPQSAQRSENDTRGAEMRAKGRFGCQMGSPGHETGVHFGGQKPCFSLGKQWFSRFDPYPKKGPSKGLRVASSVFKRSPWGPLNERSRHRSRTRSGHRTRRDAGAGARCRCEVRVQGAQCKVTASSRFEQASLQRLSTRLTRKRGGGFENKYRAIV